jgi:integrase
MLLDREHVQRMVNEKHSTPFGQRNFLNTLRALFRWAVAEGRVPSDPTLGVTRQRIKSTGYRTWSESDIEQYRRRHGLGTTARVAIELLLTTAARRGDVVKLGPQHVHDGTIAFEQRKTRGGEEAPVIIPLHPDFCAAVMAMPPSNVVHLSPATTFLTASFGQPFKTAASFGNWFRRCCDDLACRRALARTACARRQRGALPNWAAARTRLPPSPGTPRLPRYNATQRPPTGNASRRRR